jgi:hypothetical protein
MRLPAKAAAQRTTTSPSGRTGEPPRSVIYYLHQSDVARMRLSTAFRCTEAVKQFTGSRQIYPYTAKFPRSYAGIFNAVARYGAVGGDRIGRTLEQESVSHVERGRETCGVRAGRAK